jgi:hypothetical protein
MIAPLAVPGQEKARREIKVRSGPKHELKVTSRKRGGAAIVRHHVSIPPRVGAGLKEMGGGGLSIW